MVTREAIDALIGWPVGEMPVVSFFLDVDGAHDAEGAYHVRADALLRQARSGLEAPGALTPAQRESVSTDLARVAHLVRQEFERGDRRGLAVYVCTARGLWKVFALACPVKDRLVIQSHAYVRPLVRLMEENPRYGVALVDREKGRFFAIEQGEVFAQEEMTDRVPGRIRPGSWYGLADRGIERHVDTHIHQHLKHAAAVLDAFVRQERLERVLIGGTPDVVPEFRQALPRALRERVVGVVPNPLFPTAGEVLAHSREVMRGIEAEAQKEQVRALLEDDPSRHLAALGLDETLAALYRGAAETLVVGREQALPGWLCRRCGRLFVADGACPACQDAAPTRVQDVIEEAVDAALFEGAEVVFVDEDPERSAWGGVGARLRYPMTSRAST